MSILKCFLTSEALTMVQTVSVAFFTAISSSGVTGMIMFFIQRKDSKNEQATLQEKVLRGIAHDRIVSLSERYLERGYITKDEYENLHDYLFVPYIAWKGNGTAEKMMSEVEKLPVKG